METLDLLELLSDGDFHSGQDLGRHLGVSRSAIWKALNGLSEMGFQLESIKGKGYRINGGIELLREKRIRSYLKPDVSDLLAIECLYTTASTNQYAVSQSTSHDRPYLVVFSERQSEGRGRRGRSWVSPICQNIYMSIGFSIDGGADALEGLSLVLGIAVARAIEHLHIDKGGIKWPNDIWLDDRKLAGILVELQGEATSGWQVVAGIGLNHLMSEQEARSIDQPWCRLSDYADIGRNQLASLLINEVLSALQHFKRTGLSGFMEDWSRFDILKGRTVSVDGDRLIGVARGIDDSGALLLDIENRHCRVSAGEVSVRPYES